MKVTLINTYDRNGGAAIACQRLLLAHQHNDVEAHMLVQDRQSDLKEVTSISPNYWTQKKAFARFAWERLHFWRYERDASVRFAFSPASVGVDISRHPLIQEADLLHLHWVNFGFLSLKSLQRLVETQKPIVWTLHDMWAFTGGCHYAGDCDHFTAQCGDCKFLKRPSDHDLSRRVFDQKRALLSQANIHFVTCSTWLKEVALTSTLLGQQTVTSIPNPIDTNTFRPYKQTTCRRKYGLPLDKKLILFGAMNVDDPRKGFVYLKKAIEYLRDANHEDIALVVFGKADPTVLEDLSLPYHALGSISSDEIDTVYSAADVFVLPSLEDNLPNTVMESMACGTPCVAFDIGGIPDMVVHQVNGYLARSKDAEDLAKGIMTALHAPHFASKAVEYVRDHFAKKVVSDQYMSIYKDMLGTT